MAQQTAVEWLIDQVEDFIGLIPVDIIEQAKQMEKEQLENVIKEIADEDIKRKIKKEYNYTHYEDRLWMVQGAVWYKEQLKKK